MAMGLFLGILALIIVFIKYIYKKFIGSKVEDFVPVVNAVVNHSKDAISQIKPTVANYVNKHQTRIGQYCIHCGNKCDDDAAFCEACGKAIQE